MKSTFFSKYFVLYAFLFLLLSACEKEVSVIETEPMKDISGSWKIVKLLRNGEDLSERIDLSKFRINFDQDNRYSLTDEMAFVVSAPGTYALNDPQYPFALQLAPEGETEQQLTLQYLIVEGKRQLAFKTSIGCTSNSYEYFFDKE